MANLGRVAFARAIDAGQSFVTNFRKLPASTTVAGVWQDLSMFPGYPAPNYYAASPQTATVLGTGIYAGPAADPKIKVLLHLGIQANSLTPLPMQVKLCDYLLYYPFIDQSDITEQPMDNTVTLPRYTTGTGVQMMAVLVAAQAGGAQFTVKYTNSDGVSGRVTPTITCNTSTNNGSVLSSSTTTGGAFLPLQSGDTGVRLVESVTMLGADVGLMCIVLVKPLVSTWLYRNDSASDCDYTSDRVALARVYDGAYLNLLVHGQGSLSGVTLAGNIQTMWA